MEVDLARRGIQQVCAANHVCDALQRVVHDDGQLVGEQPVAAAQYEVADLGFEVLDDYNTSFEELNEVFFKHEPRAPAYGKAISSRHFDAIGAGTCQIAYRGRFNDIMVADEHYLALERDLSNADDVIAHFKDRGERGRIAGAAYEMVMAGHTYRHRAEAMLACLT